MLQDAVKNRSKHGQSPMAPPRLARAAWLERPIRIIVAFPPGAPAMSWRALHQQGEAIGSTSLPTALPLIRGGWVGLIAVARAERAPKLPSALKAAEQGFPGFAVSSRFGLLAPARPQIEAFHSFNANLTAFRPLLR
jgi:tripartite-type tricarboxylate transporter receptor subunit TctC